MKRIFTFIQILLLTYTVFGADADEVKAVTVTVTEGDSVTLNPNQDVQGIILVQWRFGDKGSTIAQISGKSTSYPEHTKIFTDRLKLKETGSLTIINMRTKHSGRYELVIDHSEGKLEMNFVVAVSEPPLVIEAYEAERKSLTVTEKYPVILHTDITKLHGDELIVWRFGDEGKLLASEDKETKSPPYYNTDERFKDRMQLNDQTGSLTIDNMKDTDAGLYTVKISSNNNTLYKKFTVIVIGSGWSPAAVAGIVVPLLLLAVVAALGFYSHCRKISEEQVKAVPAIEGNKTSLKIDDVLKPDDEVEWSIDGSPIAEIKPGQNPTYNTDERFRDELQLDQNTGTLTIGKIKPEHAGAYKLKIINRRYCRIWGPKYRTFIVTVSHRVYAVIEGDDVVLKPETKLNGDEAVWEFNSSTLAQIKGRKPETFEGPNGSFRDRLKLDEETGSLTIKDIRYEQSGVYRLEIINSSGIHTYMTFVVYFKVETITALLGESVTLKPDAKVQRDDEIQWMFGDQDQVIARMTGESREITYPDQKFRDKLEMVKNTGYLTIKNITNEQVGNYKLHIISSKGSTTKKKFCVFANAHSMSVMEGDPMFLQPDDELNPDDVVEWRFETEKTPIAEIKTVGKTPPIYNNADWRFKGRLQLDQTGSLTINKIITELAGVYRLKITSNKKTKHKSFIVTVSERILTVSEGNPAEMHTCTEKQDDDVILWLFGHQGSIIAQMVGKNSNTFEGPDGRFKDQLKLDVKTGSLTINNTKPQHSGYYKLQISNSKRTVHRSIELKSASDREMRKPAAVPHGNQVKDSVTEKTRLLRKDEDDQEAVYANERTSPV